MNPLPRYPEKKAFQNRLFVTGETKPEEKAMLANAEDIANGKAEYETYEDILGTED